MSLAPEVKSEIIKKFQISTADTSSPEVQVALINSRLEQLAVHFKQNPKDNGSRRGLMFLVGQRRRLLDYLQKKNTQRYQDLVSKLGLRK